MFGQVLLVACFLVAGSRTWSHVRDPFELPQKAKTFHQITDCMHVVSDEGSYSFTKSPPRGHETVSMADTTICGLYVVADADQLVGMSIKYMHVGCNSGGLLAFVDGWELNGEYFPTEREHELPLDRRVAEFCSQDGEHHLYGSPNGADGGRTFRSHQNAALLQYRIPVRGSFIVNVRFVANPKPCHILTEGLAPAYVLRNYGERRNCSLTALYPAVVEVKALSIGDTPEAVKLNYNCDNQADRLDIGGTSGLDSAGMEVASAVCGVTPRKQPPNKEIAPDGQAIFCGVTTVRLISSGTRTNEARISVRPADDVDMAIATMLCAM